MRKLISHWWKSVFTLIVLTVALVPFNEAAYAAGKGGAGASAGARPAPPVVRPPATATPRVTGPKQTAPNATATPSAKPPAAPMTSRAARRESMRNAGIPTSQLPTRQLNTIAGRQLHYELPRPGGGARKMVVTNQTTDRVAGHGKHWEAGAVKIPERRDPLGRTRVENQKAKVDYGKK